MIQKEWEWLEPHGHGILTLMDCLCLSPKMYEDNTAARIEGSRYHTAIRFLSETKHYVVLSSWSTG